MRKLLILSLIFGFLVAIFVSPFLPDNFVKNSVRKIAIKTKNFIYYEATQHNPEGDVVPDGIDDRMKYEIKRILN